MSGVSDLWDLCHEVLACATDALNLTDAGAPGRQALFPALPAWDCEQVVVFSGGPEFAGTSPTTPVLAPGHKADFGLMVNLVTVTVQVVRCIPVISDMTTVPSVAALDAASKVIMQDGWALWNHFKKAYRDGALFPATGGRRREWFPGPMISVGANGGFAGWTFPMQVQLDGFE